MKQARRSSAQPSWLILTDLDGTLLDATTYSAEAAREALAAMRARKIPLILSSSKTRAELETIRARLGHQDPFITENGGGVFIPAGTFPSPVPEAVRRGPYDVLEIGTPYPVLRRALEDIGRELGCPLKGFGDMSPEDIADRTGLSPGDAALAKQREYNEPFLVEGPGQPDPNLIRTLQQLAHARGLQCTRGGRFFHLLGRSDKGASARRLIQLYRISLEGTGLRLRTAALGDSLNDRPMLAAVDQPIVVQRPDGSYDPDLNLSQVIYAPGIGPIGWNRAVLDLVTDHG
ncbi:MAG: HAD-IIB family hydrolase [Nitrospirales bacterium]